MSVYGTFAFLFVALSMIVVIPDVLVGTPKDAPSQFTRGFGWGVFAGGLVLAVMWAGTR